MTITWQREIDEVFYHFKCSKQSEIGWGKGRSASPWGRKPRTPPRSCGAGKGAGMAAGVGSDVFSKSC